MRSVVATAASLALALMIAAQVAASPPERSIYTSYWAQTSYVSGLDPHAPGVYTRLAIRFAFAETRTADGTTTFSFVDIFADGWENDESSVFNRPWEGGYLFMSTPADPSLGNVNPSLADAWVGATDLAFVCYQGPCPSMPSQISVSVSWVAIGSQTATLFRPVDDIGAVSSLIFRTRPASAAVEFTGGSLDVPPIMVGSSVSFQQQVYRAPTP